MINRKQLDNLYSNYGFEVKDSPDDLGIYVYKKSRYYGVDIVLLKHNNKVTTEAEKIKKNYSQIGYATEIKKFTLLSEVEEELYRSFFSFKSITQRLIQKYNRFVKNQSDKFPTNARYEYIDSPYEILNKTSGETSIVKEIEKILNHDRAHLIIIEAAAGYGKTCTAYELLNFITTSKSCKNPIFTELSRNRGAKIFRYVLLDEIDLEYPTLNSDLVKYEIRTGRIPLIIDGFDELLDKSPMEIYDNYDAFEEVESMLDTIGNLLTKKTKIILTSRRTAIFTGNGFNIWLSKWNDKFDITVFSIKEPKIKNWLMDKKYAMIKANNFPIQYIGNPVLLSFLRHVNEKDFEKLLLDPENLISIYFNSILDREIERQSLNMTSENQYIVFKNVAKILIELDASAEDRDFFKQIIIDQNKEILKKTRSLYASQLRPSIEDLGDNLAKHALLDRKGRNDDLIGFVNDFVFGIFIGEILLEASIEEINKKFSSYMIEIGATAYRVQNRNKKILLWDKINSSNLNFEKSSMFNFDITLQEKLMQSYEEGVFENLTIFSIDFNGDFIVDSCVFVNCQFKNCSLDIHIFINSSFINCLFDNCSVYNAEFLDEEKSIIVIKCRQIDCSILMHSIIRSDRIDAFDDFEKEILIKLFEVTSQSKAQTLLKLMSKFDSQQRKRVSNKLEEFENNGLLKIYGSNVVIEINKIPWIKSQIF